MSNFDFDAAEGTATPVEPEATAAPAPAPAPAQAPRPRSVAFDFNAAEGYTAPGTPGVGGVPFEPGKDFMGRPLVAQPPPRQWSVFSTPLPGTAAAEKNLTIHPASRAVLQNFDLTSDISANSAALKKIVRGVYGPTYNANRAAPIPVDELSDDQLSKIIEEPRILRALQLDSVTRRRMAEDAEEAAILRGELPIMLSAEGAVNTMMRMMAPPETRTPEAIVAQQDRGILTGLTNALERGITTRKYGLLISFAQSLKARAGYARGDAWQTFSDVFNEKVFGAEGTAKRAIKLIPDPIDLLIGVGAGAEAVLDVYRSGGYNEKAAAALEQQAYAQLKDAFAGLKRAQATLPMSRRAGAFMQKFNELPDNFLDASTGFLQLIVENPLSFAVASNEILAEQAPVLAAGAVATAVGGPTAGITVSTLGTFFSEKFNVDDQRTKFIKEKTGIDLNTTEGQAAFLNNLDAQRLFNNYGTTRGLVIAGGQLATLGYYRGGTFIKSKSLTGMMAERTLVSGTMDGLFEAAAGIATTGKVDVKEALAEAVFGMNPISVGVDIYVAGAGDIKRRNDARKATAWLKGATELKGQIAGIPVVKLDTAASVLGEKLADEGIETVYITASELDRFDQDGSVAQTLGLDRADVRRAAAEGDVVEVTASAFVRHILGKDGFDALIEHTAFDRNGMTPAEAAEYEAAGIGDQIQQQIEERARARLAPGLDDASLSKLDADMGFIQDQVASQLEATGKYDANKSRLFGLLTAQRYATRAIRRTEETGQPVDARALFDADNLQIAGRARVQPTGTLEQAQQGFADPRIPELEQAARDRSEGRITQEEYQAVVDQYKPVLPYESVPEPATDAEMRGALASNKVGRLGKGVEWIGKAVGLRLDIPAYTQKGVWVPTIHDQRGKPAAHEAAARITNATFTEPGDAAERAAGKVGRGEKGKAPFAQINGTLESVDPAELKAAADAAINDPAWTQVGYDPRRHTFFYDRKTQQPVLSADEVIQVGPLVLAKNAKFGDAGTFLFQEGAADVQSAQALLESNPEALGLTPELAASVNPIYRPKAIPARKMAGNKAVAKWLEDSFIGEAITDMTATLTDAQIERVATLIAAEAQLALQNSGNAFDWYSAALDRAIEVVRVKYPMVADDAAAAEAGFGTASNARFVFTYIMAVTSQNLDVQSNTVATDKIFGQMLERVKAGNFTMDKSWGTGDKQKAMGENFAKFGPLIQAMPGADFPAKLSALDALFRDKRTVTQWVADMKKAGIPYSKPGQTAMSAEVYGSSLLGPKIGNGFWQNLNGNFDPLTIDLWMRRTWGRLTGKSIGNPEALPGQRKRLKDAVARSRSNQYGAPDLIAEMKERVAYLDEYIEALGDPARVSWLGDKKSLAAYIRELKAERKGLTEALPDLEGIQAPEPWKASYGRNEAELLAYVKRLLKVWDAEYKRLREAHTTIPEGLQPTWARAAKTIVTNLAKPLDQVNNGTQRTQIERAGQRAKEILRGRGIELTTADLQAVLWYPEKELWNALGTRLEVDADGSPVIPPSSLNESYDTTFARILRSQGYDIQGVEGAEGAGAGRGAVVGRDAGLEQPEGIGGAGQARGAGAGTGTLFQEVDFVGDVIFEVAPDPNNVELSSRWNALPPEVKLSISDAVSKSVLPSVLEATGADGSVFSQIGSYLNDTNPSFSLRLTSGDPAAVARAVGFVLSQDSMVALSADAFEGSFEAGAIRIQIGEKSLQEIDAIYQTLRGIEGFPQIGGQSTVDGQMTLILEEGVDRAAFAEAVDKALTSAYKIETTTVNAAFPEKKDYEYASERDDPAGAEGMARQRYRAVRDQASREVAEAIDRYEQGGQPPALAQQREGVTARGGFTPSDLITDQEGNPVNLIQIFEKADPTTFLHESGHFWLEQLKSDALSVGGQFDRDWNVVKNWWASRPLELREEAVRRAKKAKDKDAVAALQKMTEAQVAAYARDGNLRGEGTQRYLSVAMHEQFARGVENYFATGRAPSLSLASLFSAFRVWVSSVYAKLAGAKLDVKFSPEVTAVIDRMLAADEEISLIEGQYNLAAMYTTAEQAGMTPTQFAAYQKQVAEAKDERRARQLSKHIKELKRARTQWWKEAREGFREEASQQVASEPAYRLLYALTSQGLADGSTLADAERVDRMDRALLKELLEAEGFSLDDMPKVDGKAVYEDTGVSPAVVAAAFGYEDVDAMILDLAGRQPYKQSVEEAIDALMEEEHGSLESAGEAEALASAYSERTGRVLAAELEAMRTSEPAFKQKFVRAYARDRLLNTPSAEVRPFRFLAAEARHAKLAGEALKRGDKVEAYRHQFQRLVNHYMAAEALKAQSDIEKKTLYMRGFLKKGKEFGGIEADYVDNIMRILAAVNFGQGSAGQQSRLAEINALQDFIEERQKADGSILDVPAWLLDTTGNTANSAREMTYLRFLQLHETIKRYEKQGRAANKIRVGAEEQDRALVKAELLSALAGRDAAAVNRLRGKAVSAEGVLYTAASVIAQVDAQLLKVEALLEAIDGKPLGVWHQAIYEPFNQAAAQKYDLQAEVSQLIGELIEALPKEVRRNFGKRVDVGTLGRPGMKMTRGNLIMLALNVGNESNLDKLIRGMGGDAETNVKGAGWNINEQLIDTALEQLTQEEWNLVQAVWQHAEKLYPAVEAIYRREHGISPERVEPRTIKTKFGDIKGGYFPMMYDRTIAGVATDLSQKTAMELMQAEVGRATVNSSMTKARTGYAAPVDLDISRLALGMDNTIHFITHYEAVRNANKILGDKDVRAELEQKIGPAYADQLVKWVAALASNGNDSPPVDIIQKGVQSLYNNTTVAVLGFSYSTLAMQTLGLINGQDRLLADTNYGPVSIAVVQKDIAAGVAAAAKPQHVQFVMEVSGEMRSRRKNMDREVAQVLKNIAGKEGKVSAAQRFSMEAIAQVQFYTVDIPVWTAAYNRALRAEPGNTDKAIKYADRVVRLSQSAGGLKDLAAIQRHKGIVNGLTMFYSFFSALYAVLRGTGVEFSENVRSKPIAATTRAATRLFVLLALQSVATGLIRGELPDMEPEKEDEENMLQYIAKESVATALGTIPVVRDIAAGWASGYGYNGGAGTIAFEAASKSLRGLEKIINEMGEEEIVAKEADYEALARKYAPFVLLGGALTGLPAVQVNRTLDGLGAYFDEADDWNWTDLVRGYDAKRAARRE